MSNKLQNKPDPKNNDLFKEGIYFAYVEVGFSTEWRMFGRLSDALIASSYNKVFIATEMPEKEIIDLKRKLFELKKAS